MSMLHRKAERLITERNATQEHWREASICNLQTGESRRGRVSAGLAGSKVKPSVPLFHTYKQNKVFSYRILKIETLLNELRVYS